MVLLLVSPDFIASDYCYETELKIAMERHANGEARVIPVILRPSDWHDLLFGTLLGVPKDGKAVTTWPNRDEAFLDVVLAIKKAIADVRAKPALRDEPEAERAFPSWVPESMNPSIGHPRSSNLRIRKTFTDLDVDAFRHEGFDYIAKFFEASMKELVSRHNDLQQRFQRVDANHFTAAIYQAGVKVCKGSGAIGSGMMGRNAIEYLMDDDPHHGAMNEALYVKADDQSLFFEPLGMQSHSSSRDEKLTFQGAAEFLWELFIRPLQ